jgi:hypothetical protein
MIEVGWDVIIILFIGPWVFPLIAVILYLRDRKRWAEEDKVS